MKGSAELMKLVQKITGTFFHPIKKDNLMNTDMISMYYYAGVSHDDRKSHRWERVGKGILTMTHATDLALGKSRVS